MSGNLKQHFANEMDIISSTKRWIRGLRNVGLFIIIGGSLQKFARMEDFCRITKFASFARILHDAAKLRTSKDLEADIPCAASTLLQYYRAIGYPAVVASCVVRVRSRGYRAIV
ncbi:hypothetical protein JHK87_047524 [Glycine soja]|nr:hypothetical protein JHK87_047524 [Glycine soja]